MKKSALKAYIKEEIISVLSEAGEPDVDKQKELNKELEKTIELSKELEKAPAAPAAEPKEKSASGGSASGAVNEADPNDIKAQQDLSKELDNTQKKVDDLTKASQESPLAEEDDDAEPSAADLAKKDSVASAANKLQKLLSKMKAKAKEYKDAEGDAKEKIKDELKVMTAEKKKLEASL